MGLTMAAGCHTVKVLVGRFGLVRDGGEPVGGDLYRKTPVCPHPSQVLPLLPVPLLSSPVLSCLPGPPVQTSPHFPGGPPEPSGFLRRWPGEPGCQPMARDSGLQAHAKSKVTLSILCQSSFFPVPTRYAAALCLNSSETSLCKPRI